MRKRIAGLHQYKTDLILADFVSIDQNGGIDPGLRQVEFPNSE